MVVALDGIDEPVDCPGMTTKIRPASPDDAETIWKLIHDLAAYEKEPNAVKVTPDVLRTQLGQEPHPFECQIAEVDGLPVGFALFFHNYSTWRGKRGLYLEDLFVKPEHRGNGVGLALLARLAAIAIERDCARMEWSVLDWNRVAIDFYEALGARPMSEWTTWRLTDSELARLAARSTAHGDG